MKQKLEIQKLQAEVNKGTVVNNGTQLNVITNTSNNFSSTVRLNNLNDMDGYDFNNFD